MTTFKDQMTADLAVFVNPDEFGTEAVYTPALTDPMSTDVVACNVLIERDTAIQPSDYNAAVVEIGTTIEALYQDVGEPRKGATFTADGIVFTVHRITENDRVFVKMVVTEEEAV